MSAPDEGPVVRDDVVALVREFHRDPFTFALRTAFIETYKEYPEQWQDLLGSEDA